MDKMNRKILKHNATQFDTIQAIKKIAIKESFSPLIQALIYGYNLTKNDINKIFRFIYDNVYFEPDTMDVQTIRTPKRLFTDKCGNCVDYSTTLSAFLYALGVPHYLKMVSFDRTRPDAFSHIYIVLKNGLPLDLVIGQAQDRTAQYQKDRKPQPGKEVNYVNSYKLKVL